MNIKNYEEFNKSELVNLEYSLNREFLSTNRAGAYTSSTVVCCNTRKYHGLFVCPIDELDGENYVLLSTLDETVIQHDKEFNLATHRYPHTYEPRGYKYIIDFDLEYIPTLIYKVGGVVLKKELLMVHNTDQLMIRYTLMEAKSPTTLRLRPFLAYRNRHKLSKANYFAKTDHATIDNGIGSNLYDKFPTLHMQLNKPNHFNSSPDWYYNIEYTAERERGYDYQEDLFVPGYFEFPIKTGESVVFSVSLKEEKSKSLTKQFEKDLLARSPKNTAKSFLENAANQFVVARGKDTEIVAGYPWFGRWGRDTFIALPGLTLASNYKPEICKAVLDTMSKEMNNGLFPNIGKNEEAAYNSVDAPMWYFWAIQKYAEAIGDHAGVWKSYGKKMKSVLDAFRYGQNTHIGMRDNGLIWAKEEGKALTWMDAIARGKPVTPRAGYAVEINALWYNAIQYTLELAKANSDKKFVKEWEHLPEQIKENFINLFWNDENEYLADYVDEAGQNMDIRPNQVIAASMPYSMLDDKQKDKVLTKITKELLTPRGLRTLSPTNHNYKGICEGDQPTRDVAYHQGTVWVWQMGHYVEANFGIYGEGYCKEAKRFLNNLPEMLSEAGMGSISEIYDGNPPYSPRGTISQAWSVSEVLRIMQMVEKYEDEGKTKTKKKGNK